VSIILGSVFVVIGNKVPVSGQSLRGHDDHLPTNKIVVRVDGNRNAYSNSTINVSTGSHVQITFVNSARLKMHNWVMAKKSICVGEICSPIKGLDLAQAGLASGSLKEFWPEDESLFHAATPLVAARNRVTIKFDAPQIPGRYVFLCTVPGHFENGMSGVVIVSE